MFDKKNLYHYLFTISLIVVASYVGNRFQKSFSVEKNDDHEMIRNYLLNDTPLIGGKKPKIWIHSKYEVNARDWLSFQSRNSTNLNQPYLHLTIKSIIEHCGNDFHICLIDDNSFSKLLPNWDADIFNMAEPFKSRFRELALLELVYVYGGMVVPNSFVCSRNLKELYQEGITDKTPFVCERINRTNNIVEQKKKLLFIPDTYFIGSEKLNSTIRELIEYLKSRNRNIHLQNETEMLGDTNQWLIKAINKQSFNLIGGEKIGIKTTKRTQILLEDLLQEKDLDIDKNAYGVYIPDDELLSRTKYQWFTVMSLQELLTSKLAIIRQLKISMNEVNNEYNKKSEIPSLQSI